MSLTLILSSSSTALGQDNARIILDWIAPGDDGDIGYAAEYDIRYHSTTITDANWDEAQSFSGPFPIPDTAGTWQSCTLYVAKETSDRTIWLALRARDDAFNWSPLSEVIDVVIGTADIDPESSLPQTFDLGPNYPNPFNAGTSITFVLPVASNVDLSVFNLLGRFVRNLVGANLPAGSHRVTWDGTDGKGRALPSGTYFYQLTAGPTRITQKMLMLK